MSRPRAAVSAALPGREEAPIYEELLRRWAARGNALPGMPDPEWLRLTSYRHHQEETERTLRMLHLQAILTL
ncbi:hypothetical protein ABZ371_14070 [Streptomyces sp. NPDC005899]|uniref:hypothetical protein n=1 Tax=Streptomyces sp. NPDC005899 TaxID=3155716 RepID=UPI0033C414E0